MTIPFTVKQSLDGVCRHAAALPGRAILMHLHRHTTHVFGRTTSELTT